MTDISATMTGDHRRCDEIFAAAEEAVAAADWDTAGERFAAFHAAMEHHFAMEEEVLFPTFEARSGTTMGPTQVMRMEHRQIRELLAEMAEALGRRDGDGYLGAAETLLVMMQQHNIKEEQILYPMTDRVLAGEAADVLERMERLAA